jgi:hypothetical protein
MHNAGPQNSEASIKEGYEITDMNPRIISISLIGLLALMWGACVVIVMVIRGFNESREPLNTTAASRLVTPGVQVPAEPHLQGTEVIENRISMDAANLVNITTYGIVSQEPGMERVRIPVDRSMALLAEGKAPYRQAPTVAVETPAEASAPAAVPAPEAAPAPAETPAQP